MDPGQLAGPISTVGVFAASTGLVELIKPFIDQVINPRTNPLHDAVMRLVVTAVNVAGILLLAAVTPPGLHTAQAWVDWGFWSVLATFASLGFYRQVRGPLPQTPTDQYVQSVRSAVAAQWAEDEKPGGH